MFESASHVVGIQDFMIIKELDLDWRKEVRSWKKITSGELKEVRPRIGQRKVNREIESQSKASHSQFLQIGSDVQFLEIEI